jgi:hypothetical protein
MNIKHKTIDRVRITGKMSDMKKAFRYCCKHGYDWRKSGPMPIGPFKVDPTRFAITAEKEIS